MVRRRRSAPQCRVGAGSLISRRPPSRERRCLARILLRNAVAFLLNTGALSDIQLGLARRLHVALILGLPRDLRLGLSTLLLESG